MKYKNKILTTIGVVLSSAVFAGSADSVDNLTHVFGQVDGGITKIHDIAIPNYANSDSHHISASARLGLEQQFYNGWLFGGELGYMYLGRAEYVYTNNMMSTIAKKLSLHQTGIDLLAVVGKRLGQSPLSLFVKGGVAYVDQDVKVNHNNPALNLLNRDKYRPEVAAGVRYDLNNNWSISYTQSSILTNSDADRPLARTMTGQVGIRYNFF